MRANFTRKKIRSLELKIALLVVPALLLLAGLSVILPKLRERQFRRFFDQPRVIRNEQFTIYLEADDPAGDEVEPILARFLRHLYAEWGGAERLDLRAPRDLDSPVVVLLFKDHERLKAYHGPRYRDQSIEFNAGMYEPIAGTIALISSHFSRTEDLRRGLYHETTHMVLDRLVQGHEHDWSLWLNEGLATFLESSFEEPGVGFQLGRLGPEHLALVAGARSISVRDILALEPEDFRGPDNSKAYAMSAVFVAFLLEGEGGKNRQPFWRYVAKEREPGPVDTGAFERILGLDPDALGPAVQEFARDRFRLFR
jgi:hypothetical protein